MMQNCVGFLSRQFEKWRTESEGDAFLTPAEAEKQATYESSDYHKTYPWMYLEHLAVQSGNDQLLQRHHKRRVRANRDAEAAKKRAVGGGGTLDDPSNGRAGGSDEQHEQLRARLHERASESTFWNTEGGTALLDWFTHVIIAIVVAFVAFAVLIGVKTIEEGRLETLSKYVEREHDKHGSLFFGLLIWVIGGAALVTISTAIVVLLAPSAGGSGIPDVIGYLNGVKIPKVLNWVTFWGKISSCITCVGGGLPVGVEAPLIHLGAIVGAGLSQGRSKTLGCQTNWMVQYRTPKHLRHFVTAGAACGVAAAFSAPIGGLLFVMEEVASFWDHSASLKIFLGCLISFAILTILNPLYGGHHTGFVDNNVSIIFESNYLIPLALVSVWPSAVLGGICGMLAVLFTKSNLYFIRWRRQAIKPFKLRRMAEPITVAIVFLTICYLCAISGDCVPVVPHEPGNATEGIKYWHTQNETQLVSFSCQDHEKEYSPLATLMLSGGKDNIRHLLSRRTIRQFSGAQVFAYLLLYFSFACYISGSAISSGMVIPMIVIGSLVGRLFGIFLIDAFAYDIPSWLPFADHGGYYESQAWMDPGVFALIGAAAFFAGVTRLAISIAVIMVELSGELHYLLPIIVAIIVAKTVADALCVPLYHQQLHLECVPFLPAAVSGIQMEHFVAEDVKKSDPVTLRVEENTKTLFQILKTTSHQAFPVVEDSEGAHVGSPSRSEGPILGAGRRGSSGGPRFVGTVSRDDLHVLLSLPFLKKGYESTSSTSNKGSEGETSDATSSSNDKKNKRLERMSWSEWTEFQFSLFLENGKSHWHEMWTQSHVTQQLEAGNTSGMAGGTPGSTTSDSAVPIGSGGIPHESDLPTKINISSIVNRSPWVVPRFFNLKMTYELFRTMGLRHLLVTDGDNVTGVITRKDLLPHQLRALLLQGSHSSLPHYQQGASTTTTSGGSGGHNRTTSTSSAGSAPPPLSAREMRDLVDDGDDGRGQITSKQAGNRAGLLGGGAKKGAGDSDEEGEGSW